MKRLGEWLWQGRPALGAALLLLSVASISMLLVEGARAPASVGLPRFRGADKLLHFAAHFWVSLLMFWGLALQRRPQSTARRLVAAALLVLAVDVTAGIAIEYIQMTLGSSYGRVFDGKDVAANVLGTLAALLGSLFLALQSLRKRRQAQRMMYPLGVDLR